MPFPVDTLYYFEGVDKQLNAYVQQNATLVQKLMGSTLFPYSLMYVQNPHAETVGRFSCFTLPQSGSGRQKLVSCEVSLIDDIVSSLQSFADRVYDANLFSFIDAEVADIALPQAMAELPAPEPEQEAPAGRSVSFFRKIRSPRFSLGSTPVSRKAMAESVQEDSCMETPGAGNTAQPSQVLAEQHPSPSPSLVARARQIRDEILEMQREYGLDVLVSELGEDFLESLRKVVKRTLQPLLIDDSFRVQLVTSSSLTEITMPTLSRVVYILFLRHEEGIRLKEIADYRQELLHIYLTISPRDDVEQMKKSIDDLIDQESGSLNQKISRITAAFRKCLPSDIAQHYIITGPRGEARRILLDRTLVTLPGEMSI